MCIRDRYYMNSETGTCRKSGRSALDSQRVRVPINLTTKVTAVGKQIYNIKLDTLQSQVGYIYWLRVPESVFTFDLS